MAGFYVVLGLSAITFGVFIAVFLSISFAIRREDSFAVRRLARRRSLLLDAPTHSTKAARTMVGVKGSRWE